MSEQPTIFVGIDHDKIEREKIEQAEKELKAALLPEATGGDGRAIDESELALIELAAREGLKVWHDEENGWGAIRETLPSISGFGDCPSEALMQLASASTLGIECHKNSLVTALAALDRLREENAELRNERNEARQGWAERNHQIMNMARALNCTVDVVSEKVALLTAERDTAQARARKAEGEREGLRKEVNRLGKIVLRYQHRHANRNRHKNIINRQARQIQNLAKIIKQPWRDIETAPKDGRAVLLLSKPYEMDCGEYNGGTVQVPAKVAIGRWYPEGTSWVDERGRLDGDAYMLAKTGVWFSGGGWFQPNEVTGWMPLPTADAGLDLEALQSSLAAAEGRATALQSILELAATSLKPDVYATQESWMRAKLADIEHLARKAMNDEENTVA